MKFTPFKKGFTLPQLVMVVAIIGLLSALALPAMAQVTGPNIYQTGAPNFVTMESGSEFPVTLVANAGAAFAANGTNTIEKTIRQDHGLSLFVTVVSTNASAVSETLGWDVSPDATVYTTTHPLTFTVPANFAGTNTYWTNLPASTLNNVRSMQLTYATNNGGYTVKTYVRYSQSGNAP